MPTHNHDTLQGPQRPTHNFTNSQFKPHHSQSKHSHSTPIQPKSTTHLSRHHNSRHHNMSQPRSAKLEALNSDHFPIFITFKNKYKIFTTKPLRTLTNYRKANWFQCTKDLEHTQKIPLSQRPSHSKQPHRKCYTRIRPQKHFQRNNKTHPHPTFRKHHHTPI